MKNFLLFFDRYCVGTVFAVTVRQCTADRKLPDGWTGMVHCWYSLCYCTMPVHCISQMTRRVDWHSFTGDWVYLSVTANQLAHELRKFGFQADKSTNQKTWVVKINLRSPINYSSVNQSFKINFNRFTILTISMDRE